MAWFRANVARFVDGPDHVRRRAVVEEVLATLVVVQPPGGDPTLAIMQALGMDEMHLRDVSLVAAAYQPHAVQSREADDAADALISALGGRTQLSAARLSILAQAHAATPALVERMRTGDPRPPVAATRRMDPAGTEVAVDLATDPFGRGPHACPGKALALQLAAGALR